MSNFLGRGIFYYFLSTLTYDAATSGDYARQGFNSFITFCLMGLACLYIGAVSIARLLANKALLYLNDSLWRAHSLSFANFDLFLCVQAVVLDLSPTLLKGLISMQGISTGNDYDL
jgi:hypothetical protein